MNQNDIDQGDDSRDLVDSSNLGNKAAQLERAGQIINNSLLRNKVRIPDSLNIETIFFRKFLEINNLTDYLKNSPDSFNENPAFISKLKLKSELELPDALLKKLRAYLKSIGSQPLIVRSSGQIEDSYETSMAGKYSSVFCANQGSKKQKFQDLLDAIRQVYVGVFEPEVIHFRERLGLQYEVEFMALLIQPVQGESYRHYFFPPISGVALSKNPFRWTPRIDREMGMARLVCGLGTRAVQPTKGDYTRLVGLSHPSLRPELGLAEIKTTSQHYIDLINLRSNRIETVPIKEILSKDYPYFSYIAEERKEEFPFFRFIQDLVTDADDFVVTLDGLLSHPLFVDLLVDLLEILEEGFGTPVNIEFTVEILKRELQPDIIIHLLQCRPFKSDKTIKMIATPRSLPSKRIIFKAFNMIPHGVVSNIRYIVFVSPEEYLKCESRDTKAILRQIVSELNEKLKDERFILIGPGRWGSENIDLGVDVQFSDIDNSKLLVELTYPQKGFIPQLSYGTHFFMDLIEAGIFSMPISIEDKDTLFRQEFFANAQNRLAQFLPDYNNFSSFIKVVDVLKQTDGLFLQIVMDSLEDEAVGYLSKTIAP